MWPLNVFIRPVILNALNKVEFFKIKTPQKFWSQDWVVESGLNGVFLEPTKNRGIWSSYLQSGLFEKVLVTSLDGF